MRSVATHQSATQQPRARNRLGPAQALLGRASLDPTYATATRRSIPPARPALNIRHCSKARIQWRGRYLSTTGGETRRLLAKRSAAPSLGRSQQGSRRQPEQHSRVPRRSDTYPLMPRCPTSKTRSSILAKSPATCWTRRIRSAGRPVKWNTENSKPSVLAAKAHGRIKRDPQVRLGKPVIAGIRITVEHLLRCLATGDNIKHIRRNYPHLETAGIRAAHAYVVDYLV